MKYKVPGNKIRRSEFLRFFWKDLGKEGAWRWRDHVFSMFLSIVLEAPASVLYTGYDTREVAIKKSRLSR